MGKVKTPKRAGASSSPYERNSSSTSKAAAAAAAKNNVFKFNTNVGQHILKNPGIADAIVQKADLKPTDTVLEVGPGTGNISVRILEKARRLIAVELDPRMAAELSKRVQGTPAQKKLDVLLGDAIKLDFPQFDVCISNTPYQISSPLVFKLLSMPNPPRTSILMFQREFAMRLTARAGDPLYCRLSVNAQFFAKITHVLKVGKNNFKPPPQVESSVVRIEPKTGKDRPAVSFDEWDGLLRIAFGRKNRTMRASFLGTKEVLAMLERNYRTYCAMNSIPVDDTLVENSNDDGDVDMDVADGAANGRPGDYDEWGGIMDVDDGDKGDEQDDEDGGGGGDTPEFFKEQARANQPPPKTPSKRRKTRTAELVRAKILRVLEGADMTDKRASKLEENDFLRLLYEFNRENIHFA